MTYIVKMVGITKKFGDVVANDSVNFSLENGEIHALIGENGAGKTTLMRVLFGLYQPDEGDIFIDNKKKVYDVSKAMKLGIGMVHQNFMQIPSLSILENIILGRGPQKRFFVAYKKERKKIANLLDQLNMNVSLDTKVSTLSVGERQKIEIIKCLYLGAKILILDEPTAVLTPQGTEELFSIIKSLAVNEKSIVFISHKLREVKRIGDRITVMRRGKVVDHFNKGDVEIEQIARAMVGDREFFDKEKINRNKTSNQFEQNPIFSSKNLWYFSDEGIPKLKGLSFQIKPGEILGVGGVEGNGQTELANLLLGITKPDGGKIILDGKDITEKSIRERRELGLGFISEDRIEEGLAVEATIDENLICGDEYKSPFSRNLIINKKYVREFTEQAVDDYDIRGVRFNDPIKSLSGGNLQKAVLAREITRSPRVLIASQVTRGLDIGASTFVHNLLIDQKQNGLAVLMISADLDELLYLSDRIIILYEGVISGAIDNPQEISEKEIGLMMGGANQQSSLSNDSNHYESEKT